MIDRVSNMWSIYLFNNNNILIIIIDNNLNGIFMNIEWLDVYVYYKNNK